jgi:sugar-specific transcriptional regulator TrmB
MRKERFHYELVDGRPRYLIEEIDFFHIMYTVNYLKATKEDFEEARVEIKKDIEGMTLDAYEQLRNRIEEGTNEKNVTFEFLDQKQEEITDKALSLCNELEKKILQERVELTTSEFSHFYDPINEELDNLVRLLYH